MPVIPKEIVRVPTPCVRQRIQVVAQFQRRLTFGHQGRLTNGSHVRKRGVQIEKSGSSLYSYIVF